jgi:ABC-type transport system involved in multi-copper enzyme maturation permease subunit
VRRSEIVLGKWIGHWLVLLVYFVLIVGGVLVVARALGHFTPPHIERGLPLLMLEATVLLSVAIAGGTRLSTITNGMTAFGLYGFAFIGNWIEQIGTFADNVAARNVGTVSSLLMPSESLWNLAAYQMQPTIMRELTGDTVLAGRRAERGDRMVVGRVHRGGALAGVAGVPTPGAVAPALATPP